MSPSSPRRLVRTVLSRSAVALAVIALVALAAPRPHLRTEEVLTVHTTPVRAVAVAELDEAPDLARAVAAPPSDARRRAGAAGGGTSGGRIAAVSDPATAEGSGAPAESPEERSAEATAEDRAVAGDLDTPEFTTIGVTFDRGATSPAYVKVHDDRGWSDWYELHPESADGPDPGTEGDGRPGTEPIWVRGADAYVVSVDGGEAAGARVVTVQRDQRTVVGTEADAGAQANGQYPLPGSPPVNPRSAWGARPPAGTISLASSIRYAVVHHTVTANGYGPDEVPGILRSIQAYHLDGRGWSDIAYNFLVDRFGRVWEGRARALEGAAIGAHAAGFNTGSVGVSHIGSYDAVAPSTAQVNATAEIISWRLAAFRVDPSATVAVTAGTGSTRYPVGQTIYIPTVVGHGDVGATECPGAYLASRLPQIRAQVVARVPTLSGPFGNVEQLAVVNGRLRVSGWAIDPDTSAPVGVLVDVGGSVSGVIADRRRDDVQAVYGGFGPDHGFSTSLAAPPRNTKVCVYGLNQGPGRDTTLACTVVK